MLRETSLSDSHHQNVVVELSRRINRKPSFPSLQLINSICNYLPVEVVDHYDDGDVGFRYIYLDKNNFQELDARLKAERNVSFRVYLELVSVNYILKQYKLKNYNMTKNLCNYSLVSN